MQSESYFPDINPEIVGGSRQTSINKYTMCSDLEYKFLFDSPSQFSDKYKK